MLETGATPVLLLGFVCATFSHPCSSVSIRGKNTLRLCSFAFNLQLSSAPPGLGFLLDPGSMVETAGYFRPSLTGLRFGFAGISAIRVKTSVFIRVHPWLSLNSGNRWETVAF